MVRFFAISFPHFRHIFIYTGASVVTACALESYLPHSYREWLRIDELKTSILASDLLEEESPFFEQYSSHETLENLKHILFERLTAHIFDTDRSLEFYLAFFHTYGSRSESTNKHRVYICALFRKIYLEFLFS